jgi:hypothetical protein
LISSEQHTSAGYGENPEPHAAAPGHPEKHRLRKLEKKITRATDVETRLIFIEMNGDALSRLDYSGELTLIGVDVYIPSASHNAFNGRQVNTQVFGFVLDRHVGGRCGPIAVKEYIPDVLWVSCGAALWAVSSEIEVLVQAGNSEYVSCVQTFAKNMQVKRWSDSPAHHIGAHQTLHPHPNRSSNGA